MRHAEVQRVERGLQVNRSVALRACRRLHQTLGEFECDRVLVGEQLGKFPGAVPQSIGGYDAIDEAEVGAFRALIVLTTEDHLARKTGLHLLVGDLSAGPARKRRQPDLRKAKTGRFTGDDEIARQGQFEATAEGVTVDHGDGRLGCLRETLEEALAETDGAIRLQRVGARDLRDVHACDERLLSTTGEYDHPRRLIGERLGERGVEPLEDLEAQRIELVWAVDGYQPDRALTLRDNDGHVDVLRRSAALHACGIVNSGDFPESYRWLPVLTIKY